MGQKVVAMDVKLAAAIASDLDGTNVTRLARELGVSRQWVYELRRRYRENGRAGLEARSRRARSSPTQMPAEVEDAIVRLRKELTEHGADAGPSTIRWHLERSELTVVPSVAGIWRALRRRDLIEPQPAKRPRSSWRRFAFPRANECWQIDATSWTLADGTDVEIINIVDDHSRLAVVCRAVVITNTATAWAAFVEGCERLGVPGHVLSDNGRAFTGKLWGTEVVFEINLRRLGVVPITSSPRHPQTCGKVERFQQTEKRWLRAQPRPGDLAQLQAQLDAFRSFYNNDRPHRALGQATPREAFVAATKAGPAERPLGRPERIAHLTIDRQGLARVNPWLVHVGRRWSGRNVVAVVQGLDVAIFAGDELVRVLVVDPSRAYQPSGLGRRAGS